MFYLELFFFLEILHYPFPIFHFLFPSIKKSFQPTPSLIPLFLALFISSQLFLQLPQSLIDFQLSKCFASYGEYGDASKALAKVYNNLFVILGSFYLHTNGKTTFASKGSWVSLRRQTEFQADWASTSAAKCRTGFWGLISRIISVWKSCHSPRLVSHLAWSRSGTQGASSSGDPWRTRCQNPPHEWRHRTSGSPPHTAWTPPTLPTHAPTTLAPLLKTVKLPDVE